MPKHNLNPARYLTAGTLATLLLLALAPSCAGIGAPPILILEGEEDTATPVHLVALNIERPGAGEIVADIQSRSDDVHARGGLAVVAHPDRYGFTTEAELAALKGYNGLELFPQTSRSEWDAVLTARAENGEPPVWGFMSDDFHYPSDLGHRFIMVRAPGLSREHILNAIGSGSFYWGNAPLIKDVYLLGSTIQIYLTEPAKVTFYIEGGQAASSLTGIEASYHIEGHEGYVRMEIESASGRLAGTQPFVVVDSTHIQNPYGTSGRWYKGNPHAHTTASDGWLTRQQVTQLYGQNGYDFLAITDHVSWLVPVESEARIQGTLISTLTDSEATVAWVGAVAGGAGVFTAVSGVIMNGPGEYEFTIPYVPRGVFSVVAVITTSGYPVLDEADVKVRGACPVPLQVAPKSLTGNIVFSIGS